jgi:hypothetical protein
MCKIHIDEDLHDQTAHHGAPSPLLRCNSNSDFAAGEVNHEDRSFKSSRQNKGRLPKSCCAQTFHSSVPNCHAGLHTEHMHHHLPITTAPRHLHLPPVPQVRSNFKHVAPKGKTTPSATNIRSRNLDKGFPRVIWSGT